MESHGVSRAQKPMESQGLGFPSSLKAMETHKVFQGHGNPLASQGHGNPLRVKAMETQGIFPGHGNLWSLKAVKTHDP